MQSKDLAARLRKENIFTSSHNAPSSGKDTSRAEMTVEKLRTMTFRPSSMPKARKIDATPSEIDTEDDNDGRAAMIDRPAFSSPPASSRKHRSKKNSSSRKSDGIWTKRLIALNNNQTNDAMKLQHAGLNRYGASFDPNDPRKQAASYTDVTILELGEDAHATMIWNPKASTAASAANEASLVTVPCLVHEHCPKDDEGLAGKPISNALAWISVNHTTARNVGLKKGASLRVYNAVLLPLAGVEAKGQGNSSDADFSFLVICTQVCEKHPVKLDPVPDLIDRAFAAMPKD